MKDILAKRKSTRRFNDVEIIEPQLKEILWAGYGTNSNGRRTVPSAGAIYPLILYACKRDGIFRYDPISNDLIEHSADVVSPSKIVSPMTIVIAVSLDGLYRVRRRYSGSYLKYIYIEAGHVAQNITIQAIKMSIGSVMIGAFRLGKVKRLLKIEDLPIYLIPIGFYE